jgi:prophage tail gpP-like protein
MSDNFFLEINGIKYTGWQSINVSKSIENLSGQFSFQSSVKDVLANGRRFIENPIKAQDEARIFVEDDLLISGTIESLGISFDSSSHSVSVSGRDKTGDLIDSSIIQKTYTVKSFKRLIEIVLKDNGYNDIKVINQVPDIKNLTSVSSKAGSLKTEKGDTIFSFIDRYAQKLQVLINTDSDGNLIITREGVEGVGGALISTKGNPNNNILNANIQITTNERFRFIEVFAQEDNNNFGINTVLQKGAAEDEVVRNPRRIRIDYGDTASSNFLRDLAKWNINVKRAKGQRYNCRVQGYFNADGEIWRPNTLVEVNDDKCQLNGRFLIQGVTYSKSLQGSFTDLSIVNQGAFTLDTETAVRLSNSNDFASDLIRSA